MQAQMKLNDDSMSEKIEEVKAARVAHAKDRDRIQSLQGELAEARDEVYAAESKHKRMLDDLRYAMTLAEHERDEALLRINRVYVNEEETSRDADVVAGYRPYRTYNTRDTPPHSSSTCPRACYFITVTAS